MLNCLVPADATSCFFLDLPLAGPPRSTQIFMSAPLLGPAHLTPSPSRQRNGEFPAAFCF